MKKIRQTWKEIIKKKCKNEKAHFKYTLGELDKWGMYSYFKHGWIAAMKAMREEIAEDQEKFLQGFGYRKPCDKIKICGMYKKQIGKKSNSETDM